MLALLERMHSIQVLIYVKIMYSLDTVFGSFAQVFAYRYLITCSR